MDKGLKNKKQHIQSSILYSFDACKRTVDVKVINIPYLHYKKVSPLKTFVQSEVNHATENVHKQQKDLITTHQDKNTRQVLQVINQSCSSAGIFGFLEATDATEYPMALEQISVS